MAKPEKRKLERVRYWQGQMLRSRDFLDIEAVEAQRRWWHNRALHNAYGVAEGLKCSLVPPASPAGVSVCPGVAYDVFGRELILERPLTIPFPSRPVRRSEISVSVQMSLVMRYKMPSRGLRPDEISEACWTDCGSVAAGTVEFAWILTADLRAEDGVGVCEVCYSEGAFGGEVAYALVNSYVPPSTALLARPLLASGTTIPGNTPWEPWTVGFTGANGDSVPAAIGVQTWIDTSAAGFTRVPCYLASLQGSVWNPQRLQLVPAIFPSIADESVTGFTFRLWLQVVPSQAFSRATEGFSFVTDPQRFFLFARQQKLYVSWTGCQMPVPVSRCSIQQAGTALSAQAQGSALSGKS
jgi:hypothetical protein